MITAQDISENTQVMLGLLASRVWALTLPYPLTLPTPIYMNHWQTLPGNRKIASNPEVFTPEILSEAMTTLVV